MTDPDDEGYRYMVVIESSYPSADTPTFVRTAINKALIRSGLERWSVVKVSIVREED